MHHVIGTKTYYPKHHTLVYHPLLMYYAYWAHVLCHAKASVYAQLRVMHQQISSALACEHAAMQGVQMTMNALHCQTRLVFM